VKASASVAKKKRVLQPPTKQALRPLTKYAGGKSWLVAKYVDLLPDPSEVSTYHERFVGGGAVAGLYLGKVPVVLGDKNTRLMAMYRGVKDDVRGVLATLKTLVYDKAMFLATRADFNDMDGRWRKASDATRAAWFIYLNKTGFNGLYRENASGGFNVPFGAYDDPCICDEENLLAWNHAMNAAPCHLTCDDFGGDMDGVGPGDFFFFDPPYVPVNTTTAKFTEYQAGGFGPADQHRLAALLTSIDERGATFLLTNRGGAQELYASAGERWHVKEVDVKRSINSKASKRGEVKEIMVANYPLVERSKTLVEVLATET
jgi:DNA adenine methylase